MNKLVKVALLAAVVTAVVALPAGASRIQQGRHYANLLDSGADFTGSGDRSTWTRDTSTDTAGNPVRYVGHEVRTVMDFDTMRRWDSGPRRYDYGDAVGATHLYDIPGSMEATALAYDLRVVDIVEGPDNNLDTLPDYRDYYIAGMDSWTTFTDGRIDMYTDGSPDADASLGTVAWTAAAAGGAINPLVTRDTYAGFDDDFMEATFTLQPLFQRVIAATYTLTSDWVIGPGWEPKVFANPFAATTQDIVMVQRFSQSGSGQVQATFTGPSGFYVADHPYVYLDLVQSYGALFADVNWSAHDVGDIAGFISEGRAALKYQPSNIADWEVRSTDPLEFDVIPEPATMVLLGSSLLGLIPAIRRRRK